jgi:MFS family permease
VGICGSLGAATGGLLADRIGRNRESRKLLVPSAGLALSAVAGLAGYLLVLPLAPMVVLLSLSSFFASSYAGPGYAAALGFIPPHIRGTIASVLLLCFGVISYGTGTMIVGFVSDLLPASFGVRAVAMGVASALPFSLVGAGLFAIAYRERRKTERVSQGIAGDEDV